MLETHATKGNYRDFFVGLTKATVFHPEIMEEPSKGSKKILETTTKFQYSILEQQVILKMTEFRFIRLFLASIKTIFFQYLVN